MQSPKTTPTTNSTPGMAKGADWKKRFLRHIALELLAETAVAAVDFAI